MGGEGLRNKNVFLDLMSSYHDDKIISQQLVSRATPLRQ